MDRDKERRTENKHTGRKIQGLHKETDRDKYTDRDKGRTEPNTRTET